MTVSSVSTSGSSSNFVRRLPVAGVLDLFVDDFLRGEVLGPGERERFLEVAVMGDAR